MIFLLKYGKMKFEVKKMKKFKAVLACAVSAVILAGCTVVETDFPSDQSSVIEESSEINQSSETNESSSSGSSSSTPKKEPSKEPESSEPEYAAFFREKKVHEMNIEIAPEDWSKMVNNPYSKTPRRVNITIDGITINDAGIHPRGKTQLYLGVAYNLRLPYKIKFDEFVDGGSFMGLDEIALDNSACDASNIRQLVGMEAMRALGVDAPYVTFFNVSVNGKLHGFYSGIEAVDSSYLERVFGSHKHSLYKSVKNANLTPGMKKDAFEQKKGSDESRADLQRLIQVLDETPLGEKGEIEDIIDVDLVLKTLAVDAVVHNWDNYAGEVCHNFYLYMSGGKFRIIPWDLNEIFLQTEAGERSGPGSKQDIISPITGYTSEKKRPLVQKLMAVDEYYKKYIDYCEQCTNWLKNFYETELGTYKEFLEEYHDNDPTKFYKTEYFNRQFDETNRNGITGFIKERIEYLSKRIPEIREEKGLAGNE